jgi:hypothetical protein
MKITKKIAILFVASLLFLAPVSLAYPQYGSQCSNCHATAQNGLGNQMRIPSADGNVILTQGNTQTGNAPRQEMNPMRYTLGVIGTGLVVISQFYSLRKRRR